MKPTRSSSGTETISDFSFSSAAGDVPAASFPQRTSSAEVGRSEPDHRRLRKGHSWRLVPRASPRHMRC
jgi:hypothetical protein